MGLVGRWWNSQWGGARLDIWLTSDERGWHVRGRRGGAEGLEVEHDFAEEWRARAMVDRMIKAQPVGQWKDITAVASQVSPMQATRGQGDDHAEDDGA